MRTTLTAAIVAATLALAVPPAVAQVPGGTWSRTLKPTAWERLRSRLLPARGKTFPRAPLDVTAGRPIPGASRPWPRLR
jgi:hypothetical protein